MNSKTPGVNPQFDYRSVELRSLFELSQILNSSLDVDRVLNNCLLTPMGRMMISKGLALSINEHGGFVVRVVKGMPKSLLGKHLKLTYDFARPVDVNDIDESECKFKSFFQELGITLIVPITSTSRMVGAICLGAKITNEPFLDREIEFLNSLSNMAATSIENALMFQQLKDVNRRLDKKVQELNTLFDVGKELNSTLDKNKMTNILIYTIMGEMAVNKILIVLKEQDGYRLSVNRGFDSDIDSLNLLSSNEFLQRLFKLVVPTVIHSDATEPEWRAFYNDSVQLIVPLRLQDEARGMLLLGPKMSQLPYAQEDMDFLSTLCNRVMISLENARLFQEAVEKERLEEEIAIARQIQQRLLPRTFPKLESMEIYGFNVPSRQVGGDYFDWIKIDDEKIALAIGDVSGKGVGASLLMSNLHAGLHTLVQSRVEMSAMISRLNELIYENTNYDKFITFFYAEVEIESRHVRYVNAGHNPPYIFHKDGSFETLDEGGLILGMMAGVAYEIGSAQLQPGDMLITFTDGVTEAKNLQQEMYEEENLEALIAQSLDKSVKDFAGLLLNELETFSQGMPQGDDITMLGLKVLN